MKFWYLTITWIFTCSATNQPVSDEAVLELSWFAKNPQNGKYRQDNLTKELIINGYFSPVGPVRSVDGPIFQVRYLRYMRLLKLAVKLFPSYNTVLNTKC